MSTGLKCHYNIKLPKQANPEADDARPAPVGKLFFEQICTR